LLFSTLCTSVLFGIIIKVDLKNWKFEYQDSSPSVYITTAILLIFVAMFISDVYLEIRKLKEKKESREGRDKLLRDPNIPAKLKEKILKHYNSDY